MNELIAINNLYKIYENVIQTVAVEGFSNSIKKGETIALSGPSGSGKSTILNILGGVLKSSSGEIIISDKNLTKLSEDELVLYRRDFVGFIYQDFNLIDKFTIFENVALPMIIAKKSKKEIEEKVNHLLTILGVQKYSSSFPPYLSGGEKQRIAIAVALANDPELILADEPTGNLDKANSEIVIDLLIKKTRELKKTLVIATHDPFVLEKVDRIIEI